MASLRDYLPPAGGTVWRNDRRLTNTSFSGESELSSSRTRIKHIVIREVWKRTVPSPHALYKIDVMTQSNHWFILRRYREFHSLHQRLIKYGVPHDMLPSKKFHSKMSLDHLERRRNALEHYLQRLINSHQEIAESEELFEFLNVQTHDVLCVTRQLAKVLEQKGPNILAGGGVFTFTPTQMYCITRQLQLPHFTVEMAAASTEAEDFTDLGYLYSFIQELKNLCVCGLASRSSPCQELISNQAFDISLFKSLEKLQIEKCHISVINGLSRIQNQLTHVTLRHSLKTMKEFLVDCATQKRAVNVANSNVESWRNFSTTKLTENRIVVRPWILLTHVNMSHNKIATLDHSFKLLPALEQLDLSYNEFVHLDLKQLTSSTLTFLNLSHNNIHYISATTKDLRNLKSLLLSHNKLQTLDGLDCLRGLVELDIRDNEIKVIDELAKISPLLHMRILALTGNPCVAFKSHRIHVFGQLKTRELILDGIKITESEKVKVQRQQERKNDLAIEFSKPATSATSGQNPQNFHKTIIKPEKDDDQDSGFGGNYGGSIDDGGLVFDWSYYGNIERLPVAAPGRFRSEETAGPSGICQGSSICLKTGNESSEMLVPDGNDLQVSSRSVAATSPLKQTRIDKGKSRVNAKRPGIRKNVSKSSARIERHLEVDSDDMAGTDASKVNVPEVMSQNDTTSDGTAKQTSDLETDCTDGEENSSTDNNPEFVHVLQTENHSFTNEHDNCSPSNSFPLKNDTSVELDSLGVDTDADDKPSSLGEKYPLTTASTAIAGPCLVYEETASEVSYESSSFVHESCRSDTYNEQMTSLHSQIPSNYDCGTISRDSSSDVVDDSRSFGEKKPCSVTNSEVEENFHSFSAENLTSSVPDSDVIPSSDIDKSPTGLCNVEGNPSPRGQHSHHNIACDQESEVSLTCGSPARTDIPSDMAESSSTRDPAASAVHDSATEPSQFVSLPPGISSNCDVSTDEIPNNVPDSETSLTFALSNTSLVVETTAKSHGEGKFDSTSNERT